MTSSSQINRVTQLEARCRVDKHPQSIVLEQLSLDELRALRRIKLGESTDTDLLMLEASIGPKLLDAGLVLGA